MIPWTPTLSVILAALPGAYELDFRALPAPDTTPAYKYEIAIDLDGQEGTVLRFTLGTAAGPSDGVHGLVSSLGDTRWKLKRDGDRVVIDAYDKARVTKVTVTGDGPKPAVRRVIALPEEKKQPEKKK